MSVFTERERSIVAPPPNTSTREWGEKNRELSVLTSASAGRWTMNSIPFLAPVLEALDDEDVESVVLQKSTQIAGTETFITWLAKTADIDPGPAMMVFADEDTSDEVMDRRIMQTFRNSPPISRVIDESKFCKKGITLLNNFSLVPAWASSIAKTASRPIRYLYLSEITKPGYGKIGDEGSVLTRIFQRTETFPNKKIAIETTPTIEGDNIDKQMQLCEVVYDWHVPCPHCGVFQPLRWTPQKYRTEAGDEAMTGRVVFDDGDDIIIRSESARYECGACKARWTTAEKNNAVSLGRAVPRAAITRKPKRVGFHISRLYSLFPGGRLEALALSFLQAKDDPLELQSFINNSLAEHWKTKRSIEAANDANLAQCAIERCIVPDTAEILTITVDMQLVGFWYLVRAWNPANRDSWMIECGQLGTWDDVSDLLFNRAWTKANGDPVPMWRAALDSGGTKKTDALVSRTEELYSWWIANRHMCARRVFVTKGSSRAMPYALSIGKALETTPSGKKITGAALSVVELNTPYLKDQFFDALERAKTQQSRAAYLHKDTPQAYFGHISAERKTPEGDYEAISGRDNHWLDCEMMQQALVSNLLFGGIQAVDAYYKREKQAEEQKEQAKQVENQQPVQPTRQIFNPYLRGRENPLAKIRRP